MSEDDFRRDDEARERQDEARAARDRQDLAEIQTELREFRGCPVNAALDRWLKAMEANAWGYAPLVQRSEIVAADPLGTQRRRAA